MPAGRQQGTCRNRLAGKRDARERAALVLSLFLTARSGCVLTTPGYRPSTIAAMDKRLLLALLAAPPLSQF